VTTSEESEGGIFQHVSFTGGKASAFSSRSKGAVLSGSIARDQDVSHLNSPSLIRNGLLTRNASSAILKYSVI